MISIKNAAHRLSAAPVQIYWSRSRAVKIIASSLQFFVSCVFIFMLLLCQQPLLEPDHGVFMEHEGALSVHFAIVEARFIAIEYPW